MTPEWMDDPSLPRDLHAEALAALRRIHRVSRTASSLWRHVRPVASGQSRPLRVLDLACGRGDMMVSLARFAARDGCEVRLAGCDVSPTALELARRRLDEAELEAELLRLNLPDDPIPQRFDVMVTSLFLHHLTDAQILRLMQRVREAAAHFVASDLVRSRWGLLVTWVGTRTLTRCPVVHVDGMRSVRAAPAELRALADRAGLSGAVIERTWPARQVLRWSANGGSAA